MSWKHLFCIYASHTWRMASCDQFTSRKTCFLLCLHGGGDRKYIYKRKQPFLTENKRERLTANIILVNVAERDFTWINANANTIWSKHLQIATVLWQEMLLRKKISHRNTVTVLCKMLLNEQTIATFAQPCNSKDQISNTKGLTSKTTGGGSPCTQAASAASLYCAALLQRHVVLQQVCMSSWGSG